jgi:TatA/E family protein of Tat protein translocase
MARAAACTRSPSLIIPCCFSISKDDAACSTSSGSSLYSTFPSSHRSSSSRVSAAVHLQRPRLSTRNKARCSLVRARELSFFASWNARSHLIPLVSSLRVKGTRVRKTGVQASLLGVGAPEVLVIGVVALLVFGPKGLAEVARTLGNSLRAFQPTIRELQQVSKEFKSTLEQEIGLDELSNPSQAPTSIPLSPFQQPTIPFKEGRTPFCVSLKHLGVVYMCLSLSLQNLNNKIPFKEKRCAFGKYC